MKRVRLDRPMLNTLDAGETALIWNPRYGFRLAAPRRKPKDQLSLAETFLTILAMQVSDEMMTKLTGDYLAHFKKH